LTYSDLKKVLLGLRIIQSFIAITSVIQVIRYHYNRRSLKEKFAFSKNKPLFIAILECIVSFIHVPPGLDLDAEIFSDSSFLDILVFLAFSKLYILIRIMKNASPLNTHSARFVGSFTKVNYGDWFLIKVWLKANPVVSLFFSWLVITFISSYLLYLAERKYPSSCGHASAEFDSYFNSVWCIIITVLTVGYGDVAPDTFIGRTIVTLTTFFGLVCTATLIGIVSDYLSLNNEEFVVIKFIDEHKRIKIYESAALKCVKAAIRTYIRKKKRSDIENAVTEMEELVSQFRYYRAYFFNFHYEKVKNMDTYLSQVIH